MLADGLGLRHHLGGPAYLSWSLQCATKAIGPITEYCCGSKWATLPWFFLNFYWFYVLTRLLWDLTLYHLIRVFDRPLDFKPYLMIHLYFFPLGLLWMTWKQDFKYRSSSVESCPARETCLTLGWRTLMTFETSWAPYSSIWVCWNLICLSPYL